MWFQIKIVYFNVDKWIIESKMQKGIFIVFGIGASHKSQHEKNVHICCHSIQSWWKHMLIAFDTKSNQSEHVFFY